MSKFSFFLLALCLAIRTAAAQHADTSNVVNDNFVARLDRATFLLPHDSAEIPFEEDHSGRPVIAVMINGRGPFHLAFETGAKHVMLDPRVIEAAAISSWGDFSADSMRAGDVRFQHVIVEAASVGSDGLFGLNAYYDALVTIDYSRRRIRFTRGALPPANGRDILDLQTLYDSWYAIDISVNGRTTPALVDTQHEGYFWAVPETVADSQFVSPPVQVTYGPGGLSQPWSVGRWRDTIGVAGVTFHQPLVDVEPRPTLPELQAWFIGWYALRHFTVTIDQRNRRIRLASSTRSIMPPPSYAKMVTIRLNESDAIMSLSPESVATRQGLRLGDQILEVEGMSADSLDKVNWLPWDRIRETADSARMVIRRGAETIKVTLTKTTFVK